MDNNPFIKSFLELPDTLPIFPLHNTILMPGNELPLNIFEPQYLNMISDALASHRMIGMIQPNLNSQNEDALYTTGCAGRITQYRETIDGRIIIVITGVCRFNTGEELSSTRGYRLIVPNWSNFSDDYVTDENILGDKHDLLIRKLELYFDAKELHAEWSEFKKLSTLLLINSMSMALPFCAEDKQTLLETSNPLKRFDTFIALLDSDLDTQDSVTRH